MQVSLRRRWLASPISLKYWLPVSRRFDNTHPRLTDGKLEARDVATFATISLAPLLAKKVFRDEARTTSMAESRGMRPMRPHSAASGGTIAR